MDPLVRPDPRTLLEHRTFVRAVARRLLRDEHEADDAVQETWLRALRSPPRGGPAFRAWLARVGRNVALSMRRADRRRERHERAAAPPEAVPSAADTAARLEQLRLVVEAVLALDEPFRSTVLLRYYDDLPPREIARRLGVPVETVRSRLRRAVERMRGWFDARHGGDRAAWSAALLPLVAERAAAVAGAKLVAAALLLGAAAVAVVAWTSGGRGGRAPPARAEAPAAPAPAPREDAEGARGPEEEPRAAPPAADARAEGPGAAADVAIVRSGVVVGRPPARRPLHRLAEPTADPERGGLRVRVTAEADLRAAKVTLSAWTDGRYEPVHGAVAGADGSVEFVPLAPGRVLVLVALPPRHRSAPIEIEAGRMTEIEVPFAGGARVEGVVRHVERGPLAGADVRLERNENGLSETIRARTDEGGRFRFEVVPEGTWHAWLPGDAHKVLAVRGRGTIAHDFVLGVVSLEGTVRDASSGEPLPDARIHLQPWTRSATTDAAGTYRFPDLRPGDYLVAAKRDGYGPGFETGVPVTADGARRVDFALERAAALLVEVRDREGRPVAGRHRLGYRHLRGEVSTSEWLDADAEGKGRFARLSPGTWVLDLDAEGYLPQGATVEIAAGENRWQVTLDRAAPRGAPSVSGTVRDRATGRPVAGVRVSARPQKGGIDRTASTDAGGAYRLHDLPDGTHELHFSRDGYGFESIRDVAVGGRTRAVDVALVPAATLRLLVTDRAGRPVPGSLFLGVTSTDGTGTRVGTSVDADSRGAAVYRQVVPGSYRLHVKQGDASAHVETEIAPGENTVRVRLE